MSTYSNWERDAQHGDVSYWLVARVLGREFGVTLRADDVARGDLEAILKGTGAHMGAPQGEADAWGRSRRELDDLLQSRELCYILGLTVEAAGRLRGLVEKLRPDLDRSDWMVVARAMQEGGPEVDLSLWRDGERVREPMYFKTPRPLTAGERAKIQKIADSVLEKLRKQGK